ncbi:hypothetical protein NKI15_26430 [Mesorhizobium sp. M0862]
MPLDESDYANAGYARFYMVDPKRGQLVRNKACRFMRSKVEFGILMKMPASGSLLSG